MGREPLNLHGARAENPAMEHRGAGVGSRLKVIAICAFLFVVESGFTPVSGMEMVHEASLAPARGGTRHTGPPAGTRDEVAGRPRVLEAPREPEPGRAPASHGPPESFNPPPGQAVFRIDIPAIELHRTVVQGVEAAQLARGPGHYPSCGVYFAPPYCSEFEQVWPGEIGRTVVGGHRTTAGADFFDLGELRPSDEIEVHAAWGDYVFRVTRQQIVADDDRSVIVPGIQARELMLVTCHPKFSSEQRLLVFARLEPPGARGATSAAAPSEPARSAAVSRHSL
jgi:LPXTG-site transpeptidase (sortase) family protein